MTEDRLPKPWVAGLVLGLSCVLLAAAAAIAGDSGPSAPAKEKKTSDRTIRVHVNGPDGKPIAGAEVHSSAVATKQREIVNRDYVSGADGSTVVELPKTVDLLRLWARKDACVPLFAHWEQQWFNDGNRLPEEFTFRLTKGTTIGGSVKNEVGQPIAGVKVGVSGRASGMESGVMYDEWLANGKDSRTTDAQGRWTLDNVPPGDDIELKLSFTHPDYISDARWGGLQELQNTTLKSLRSLKATIVLCRGSPSPAR